MIRSTPLSRGSRRLGDAARERRAAGGKRAVGRDSATATEWQDTRARVWLRSAGRCEVELTRDDVDLTIALYPNRGLAFRVERTTGRYRCRHWAVDPAHVSLKSRGAGDTEAEVYASCRWHHWQQDRASYQAGKLVVRQGRGDEPLFVFSVVQARDKWAARAEGLIGGGR